MEQHILSDIPDYVLDLLADSDRRRVETHAAHCANCRVAIERERLVEQQVRQTVQFVAQPNVLRLQAIRPAVIPRRNTRKAWIGRQLAPAMLLLVILAGTLVLQTTWMIDGLEFPAPAFYRNNTPTVTNTSTPTATIAGLTLTVPATIADTSARLPTADLTRELIVPQQARPSDSLPLSTPVAATAALTTN